MGDFISTEQIKKFCENQKIIMENELCFDERDEAFNSGYIYAINEVLSELEKIERKPVSVSEKYCEIKKDFWQYFENAERDSEKLKQTLHARWGIV